jgi:predicted hotdog family 3-hydroxylacyl-ACP dehydratase
MTRVAPAEILRHRGPALLVGAIDGWDGETLRCRAAGAGPWSWPAMLEGAAQTAGLAAGLRPRGLPADAVVAEYRDVVLHAGAHAGPIRFVARVERRVLHFWRCRVEVRDAAGALLLEGTVALAPEPAA